MADPFEKMKNKIKKATAFIIGVYFILLIYLIFPKWLSIFIIDIHSKATLIIWIVPLALIAFASYFIIFDIHNWFDKKIFKERQRINNFIREQLTKPCKDQKCKIADRGILKDEESKLMDLFYTFIPDNDTERHRAFQYWGDYFVSTNLSVFSTIGFIIALIYVIIICVTQHLCKFLHLSFILSLILPVPFYVLHYKTKKRLIYPANAQTKRILTQDKQTLKKRLPDYRIGCRKYCPLIHKRSHSA